MNVKQKMAAKNRSLSLHKSLSLQDRSLQLQMFKTCFVRAIQPHISLSHSRKFYIFENRDKINMWQQKQLSLHFQCVDTAKTAPVSSYLPLSHHGSIFVLLNATHVIINFCFRPKPKNHEFFRPHNLELYSMPYISQVHCTDSFTNYY